MPTNNLNLTLNIPNLHTAAAAAAVPIAVTPAAAPKDSRPRHTLTISSVKPSAPLPLILEEDYLKNMVKLPKNFNGNSNHWIANHTIDFFQLISLLSIQLHVTKICTEETCPIMNNGTSSEYVWRVGALKQSVPAHEYIALLLNTIEEQIYNPEIFPTEEHRYPDDFDQITQGIFRRLFRVFTHVFTSHYDNLERRGLNATFNTIFIHFMHFSEEFNLMSPAELQPAQALLKDICSPIFRAILNKIIPKATEEKEGLQRKFEEDIKSLEKQLRIIESQPHHTSGEEKISILKQQKELLKKKRMITDQIIAHELLSLLDKEGSTQLSLKNTTINVADISTPRRHSEVEEATVSIRKYYQKMQREQLNFCRDRNQFRPKKTTLDDFILEKFLIGKGGFGEVRLCRRKGDLKIDNYFVIKSVKKKIVVERMNACHIQGERNIMIELSKKSEFLVKLHETFQDKDNLYFVMDFCQGGDLMERLMKDDIFRENVAKFYIAELIIAVEELHRLGCAHRDLKPDNLLLGKDGHLRIADFGFARLSKHDQSRPSEHYFTPRITGDGEQSAVPRGDGIQQANAISPYILSLSTMSSGISEKKPSRSCFFSMVGSPDYIAPEVLLGEGHSDAVDWWAVGVILFEMVCGYAPFHSNDVEIENTRYKIQNHKTKLKFPEDKPITKECKEVIRALITDPDKREQINIEELKRLSFFNGIDWKTLRNQKAPFKDLMDEITGPNDVRFFEIIEEPIGNQSQDKTPAVYKHIANRSAYFYKFTSPNIGSLPSESLGDESECAEGCRRK